jgi:hypothetical protein
MDVHRVLDGPHPIGEFDQHVTRRASDPLGIWIPSAQQLVEQFIV